MKKLILLMLSLAVFGAEEKKNVFHMEEVVVETSKTNVKLKNSPVKVNIIDSKKIEKKGATDILEVLESTVGIRIDNQCSICNTTGVKLSGAPSRYTLLLIDGFPIHSSLGQVYGWMNINASKIERIEIIKGNQSVLYGTDAIGGVINVITKKPHGDPHSMVNFELGMFDYQLLSASSSYRVGKLGISITGVHSKHGSIDRDGDQISEYTGYLRKTLNTNITYEFTPKFKLFTSFSFAQEKRQGGGLGSFVEVLSDDRRDFSESVLTERFEAKGRLTYKVNNAQKINFLLSYSKHIQDSDYESEVYVGEQDIVFSEINLNSKWHKYVKTIMGVSFRSEKLDENLAINEYHYYTTGVFAQGKFKIGEKFKIDPGVRYDYHNEFGHVFTPALSMKYDLNQNLTFRLGGGTAFRAPSTFYEYAHGVRPEGYKLINKTTDAEKSYNVNGDITFNWSDYLSYNFSAGFNRINNAITVEVNDEGNVEVFNVDGHLDILSIENTLSLMFKHVDAELGYGFYKYTDDAGALVSAPVTHQLTYDLNFKYKKINLNINGGIFAPMDLNKVYGDGFNIQKGKESMKGWLDPANADINSKKMDESPWYHTMNVKVIFPIYNTIKLTLGIKNLTDYHQSDKESPLFFPADDAGKPSDPDVVYIWGPLRGRFAYGGISAYF